MSLGKALVAEWTRVSPIRLTARVCLSSEEGPLGTTGPEEIRRTRPPVARACDRPPGAMYTAGLFAHSPCLLSCPLLPNPSLGHLPSPS